MGTRSLEVADVFRRYGEAYRQQHGTALTSAQRRAMTAIELCRTSALGGHVEQCDSCGHQRIWYNSCCSRSCPKCQSLARAQWLVEVRQAELLDTQYFHVVFTIPHEIAVVAYQNKSQVYDILFRAAAGGSCSLGLPLVLICIWPKQLAKLRAERSIEDCAASLEQEIGTAS
jgi:hypothetical protein